MPWESIRKGAKRFFYGSLKLCFSWPAQQIQPFSCPSQSWESVMSLSLLSSLRPGYVGTMDSLSTWLPAIQSCYFKATISKWLCLPLIFVPFCHWQGSQKPYPITACHEIRGWVLETALWREQFTSLYHTVPASSSQSSLESLQCSAGI